MLYDPKNDSYIELETNKALRFLYNTLLGRLILKIAISKPITKIYAKYMNSKLSIKRIKRFIKENNIDMTEYEEKDYSSFNDFFMRKIKKNKRTIEDGIISVCDSKLSVYKIVYSTVPRNQSSYTIGLDIA